jgi:hypothetical protein
MENLLRSQDGNPNCSNCKPQAIDSCVFQRASGGELTAELEADLLGRIILTDRDEKAPTKYVRTTETLRHIQSFSSTVIATFVLPAVKFWRRDRRVKD